MYNRRFVNAKNHKGKLYRNKQTGDLVEYCLHMFAIYPEFENNTTYHAGLIPEQGEHFARFVGVCLSCGEMITIFREDVFENYDKFDKHIEKVIKEDEISQENKNR